MKAILKQSKLASGILREQEPLDAGEVSAYCLRVPCEEGELWYHNLTGELLLLSNEEARAAEMQGEFAAELVRRWFSVPKRYDERKLADQLRTVSGLLGRRSTAIYNYVVFTTTDCNARCYYCYELGRSRVAMSEGVAHDVAAYIGRNSAGKTAKIQWFGGEPLFNRKAIDVITGDLVAGGVDFTSTMTSNAYLFDETTVERALRQWRLRKVQVTLDGTEAVYNRTKAFVYRTGSPFQTVIANISLLLQAGIKVTIRLNMDGANADDLEVLADELMGKFGAFSNLTIYTVLLRDFGHPVRAFDSWQTALSRHKALQERLISAGVGLEQFPPRKPRANQCMADADTAVVVLPDGRLGKCEHESEENLVGSIYEDGFDQHMVDSWKELIRVPECDGCLQYPTCFRLKKCAWHSGGCSEWSRTEMRVNLTQKVLNEYARYRKGGERPGR